MRLEGVKRSSAEWSKFHRHSLVGILVYYRSQTILIAQSTSLLSTLGKICISSNGSAIQLGTLHQSSVWAAQVSVLNTGSTPDSLQLTKAFETKAS